jgi:hypothetical protein
MDNQELLNNRMRPYVQGRLGSHTKALPEKKLPDTRHTGVARSYGKHKLHSSTALMTEMS